MKKIIIALILAIIALIASVSSYEVKDVINQVVEPKDETRILFVGDMMFDRTIRNIAEKRGYDYIFSCVEDYLKGFDLVVANLEGPITAEKSLSAGTNPGEAGNTTFTFDEAVARALDDNNIKVVNLGNNHILDFGEYGIESTKRSLDSAGILYFGAPGGSFATTTTNGRTIAFVNYNQFLGQDNPQITLESIWKAKREAEFVFVYAHWGEEYVGENEYQKALAHSFIDAGADAVIGSHPHVYQSHEIYSGRHIFYSLGNFIFDQYFNDEVKKGAGVESILTEEGVMASDVLFDIGRDGRTCRASL